jgi:DHA1 family tetracycline resistance protein-like MFS transporter
MADVKPEFGQGQVEIDPSHVPGLKSERERKSALLIVFLVVFIDLLGFGIVLPLLPLYGEEFIGPLLTGDLQSPVNRAIHGIILGLLLSSFSAMQFLFAPIWGRVSDRIGRRPILLMGLAGSVVFYALFGLASEVKGMGYPLMGLVLMFVARIGSGVAGATIATAQAVIADSTPPERRARGMALIGVAFGIGFTFGPLLGYGSLFVDNEGMPGYLGSAISLVALIIAVTRLPETLKAGNPTRMRRWFDWQGFRNALRTPSVGILVIVFFLAVFAFGNFEATLSLLVKAILTPGEPLVREGMTRETFKALKSTERVILLSFAYVGFVLMLTQGLVYRRLVMRVGEVLFLKIGLAFMTLGLAGIGVIAVLAWSEILPGGAMTLTLGLSIVTLAVIGFALLNPSIQALISRRSDPAKQGEVLGVNQSAASLSRILGPALGLPLFTLNETHVLPYVFGSILLIWAFCLGLQIHEAPDAKVPVSATS